jgi:hypothetical protein
MKSMKSHVCFFAVVAGAAFLAGCVQPQKIAPPAKASLAGSQVSGVGKVTLHAGQPCAPQIMFDFRMTGAHSMVQLAAPMGETRLLTDAANRNRRVRIWGKWQRSQDRSCDYINVSRAELLSIAAMF